MLFFIDHIESVSSLYLPLKEGAYAACLEHADILVRRHAQRSRSVGRNRSSQKRKKYRRPERGSVSLLGQSEQ